jgi:hypothetical protein
MPQGIQKSLSALEGKEQTIQGFHSHKTFQKTINTMGALLTGHQ